MTDPRKPHPLVDKLLNDFEAKVGGPRMPDEKLVKWTKLIRRHDSRADIVADLILLARGFAKNRGDVAATQLVALVVVVTDQKQAEAALAQSGASADEAKSLLAKAKTSTASLAAGLAPPKAGSGGPSGVGLRKKR